MTKKYTNTTWTEYSLDEVEVETEDLRHRSLTNTQEHNLITTTGKKFYTLSALYTKEVHPEPTPPIILDEDELKLTKLHMRKMKVKRPADVVKYLEALPDKKIYMRTVCPYKNWERRQVFTHDAIDVINILLEKLQMKVKKFEIRMEKYRKRWENNDDVSRENFTMISVLQFQEALEDFDIDKSLITLVPDIFLVYQVKYQCHVATEPGLITLGPAGDQWVDANQAIFMLFHDVVMEVNWMEDVECNRHKNCNKTNFRQQILDLMKNYEQYGDWSYLRRSEILEDISKMRTNCNYRLRERKPFTPSLEFLYCDYNDKITVEYFVKKCDEFGFKLTKFTGYPPIDSVFMPAWKARVIFMLLWTDVFFDELYAPLRRVVIDAIAFKVPFLHWSDGLNPLEVILSVNPYVMEQELLTGRRNAVDLTEHAKEMRCKVGEFTTFTHPWMRGRAAKRWMCDPNLYRCKKWALRESTYEMRNGRAIWKSPAKIEKLIEDYLVSTKKAFQQNGEKESRMARVANQILFQILKRPEDLGKANNKEEAKKEKIVLETIIEEPIIEKEETPEEKPVPDYIKLSNNLDVLAERMFLHKKQGLNQWRHVRDIRDIIKDSVIRHYNEMLQLKNEAIEKHEILIQKHEELLKIVKTARENCSILFDPSEPSTSTATFIEN